jgi:Uma2 family endonuclease
MVVTRARQSVRPPIDAESRRIPPLENGDRLTRAEFERRYGAMEHVKKAELIEGVVHMPTPVKVSHGQPHAQLITWLGVYCTATPHVDVYDNTTVRLDADNEVQPDALLRLESGGHSTIGADGYIEGAPELIAEIAASSAAIDLHAKMNVYRRNGVREYVVWQTFESRLDWYELRDEVYAPLTPDAEGIIRSNVFPGLWLNAMALVTGDLASVLMELQKGLASKEHGEFLASLEKMSAPSKSESSDIGDK